MSTKQDELELKYDAEDLPALRRWLDEQLPSAGGWQRATVRDRYFDTADQALARGGYGARLRRAGEQVTLALKADVSRAGALHHRRELEAPATSALEPAEWPASEARDLVASLAGGRRLVERFILEQRRRERVSALDGGATSLLSLDEVRVIAGGATVGTLRQLEVELIEGERRSLSGADRLLRGSGLVRPQPASKMALAAEMAAAAGAVTPDDRWPAAGRKVLRRHVLRMLEREPKARAGEALALKQMRVATRRARATLRLFGDAFRRPVRRRHIDGLRSLGRRLGAVRDLDVLLAGLPDDRRLAGLARDWRAQRAAAFDELLAALDEPTYTTFIDGLLELTEGDRATRRPARRMTVAERAPAALRAGYEALLASAPADWAAGDDDAWHALRRRSRQLRYSLEALREPLPAAQVERLIGRLVHVQDHLGELNDAVVTAAAVDAWLAGAGGTAPKSQREAAIAYRERRLAAVGRLRAGIPATWRTVDGAVFRRMLERAVAER